MRFLRMAAAPGALAPAVLAVVTALAGGGCGPGQVAWTRVIDCGADDVAVALDGNGPTLALLATSHAGQSAVWQVITMTTDGGERWRRRYRQGETSVAGDIAIDSAGNVYATGTCLIDGREMCVVVRYRPDGAIAWQQALAIGDASGGQGIALDGERVWVGGWTRVGDRQELLLAALAAHSGNTLLVRNWPLGSTAAAERLAPHPQGGLVLTGLAGSAADQDILLARFDPEGDTLWTRRYDSGGEDRPGGVATDRYGHVLAAGTALTAEGPRCVILEYHPDGELIRRSAYGERATAEGGGIALTAEGDVFIAGSLVAGDQRSMLAFHYRPGAISVWERGWQHGDATTGADIVMAGDAYVLGTVGRPGDRDIALVRFTRPVAD